MHIHEEDIAPKLVMLYSDSLAAALDTPDTFVHTLIQKLQTMVHIHGLVMIVEPELDGTPKEREGSIAHIHLPSVRIPRTSPSIQVESLGTERGRNLMDELMAKGMEDLRTAASARFPGYVSLHTYWFRTSHTPDIATCLFRAQMPKESVGDFTHQERELIGRLEQHIGLCMRVHVMATRSGRMSFDFFADICREIASTHGLTATESRVLRKMVDGAANKEIGQELQISLATVKTHISHILQKTGCRNRADLIGRYFSSKKAIMR